jgi:murein L,D-transpeptidase YcbB/YkuD
MIRVLLVTAAIAAGAAAEARAGLPDLVPAPGGGLTEEGARILRAHVLGGVDAELRWSDFGDLRPELERFYGERAWTLAWLWEGRPTDAAWQVAGLLSAAGRKGLDPADYGAGSLEPRLAAADRVVVAEAERVRIDVALTVSALRYAGDLALGRIRPLPGTELLGRTRLARLSEPPPDAAATVAAAAGAVDPEAIFAALEPDWAAYRRTLAELDRWRALDQRSPSPALPVPAAPIAPEHYPALGLLEARLAEQGFSAEAPSGAEEGAACRSPLADVVARFQERRGLDATGFVDGPTVRELGVPPWKRAEQLAMALERWRWFGRRPPASWIVVNVPEFALHAGNGEEGLRMRVVVGQAYEWGTPLLASELAQVIFRPAWNVPLQIQQEELVPRVEADRGFVAAGGFEVLDEADRPVPPLSNGELLSGLRSGALKLRQRPGGGNALGPVKLSLARSAWLYLHGTPSTELFSRSRRDFSHGCIRVEDPEALVAWVLREERGWTAGAIRSAMAGGATVEVTPARPPTVLIAYLTAAAWDEWGGAFYPDVYGQDAALSQALSDEAARRGGG